MSRTPRRSRPGRTGPLDRQDRREVEEAKAARAKKARRETWSRGDSLKASDFGGRLPVALIFPGPASEAFSGLGWQAVWRLLADLPGLAVERVFATLDAPPRSRDSGRPLSDFPVWAVSLGHEEQLAVLAWLFLSAGLSPLAASRPDHPLVLVGGPLAFLNPAPLVPGVDALFCGEAEAGLAEVVGVVRDMALAGADKSAVLDRLAALPGVLAPGRSTLPVARLAARDPERPGRLACPAASSFVSSEAALKDMFLVEINRGCPYACRFCAAGYIYRPPRQSDPEAVKAAITASGARKVGLMGTALTDWPHLPDLLDWLNEKGLKFGLSSVRADGLTGPLLAAMRRGGARTVTLALEGASARLRRACGKRLRTADFLRAVALCAEHGVNHLKIYLIVGWPGETEADYAELSGFLAEAALAGRVGQGRRGIGHLTVSASALTPKPFTPLAFAPMASEAALKQAADWLRRAVKPHKGLRADIDPPFAARLQGLLARGDASAYDLAVLAAERGGDWRAALAAWDGDPAVYLDRDRGPDEPFPWEALLDVGVSRRILWREWERYKAAMAAVDQAGPAETVPDRDD